MRKIWLCFAVLFLACGDRVELEPAPQALLGMSFAEFAAGRDLAAMQRSDLLDFRFELSEAIEPAAAGQPVGATYYFQREGEQRLYEIILEFRDPAEAAAHARSAGKVASPGGKWTGRSEAGLPLESWTYEHRFMLKAGLDGRLEKSVLMDSPEGRKLDEAMEELKRVADELR